MEYRKIIQIQYREYDRRILEKSWEWLNDPEIKRIMNISQMDKESQEVWFQNLHDRKDYHIEGIWREDEPIGAIGLKNITTEEAEIFGYIGVKRYWGKAIGVDMMQRMLDHGKFLGLKSIYAKIRNDNTSSIKLHNRFGFHEEFKLSDDAIQMRILLDHSI